MEHFYHLRITIDREDQSETTANAFYDKWKDVITKIIISYEFKEYKGIKSNHHIHGHILFNQKFVKENVRYYLKTKHGGMYNFEGLKKEPHKNEMYVCKELRIKLKIGYTDEQINQIKDDIKEIQEDMEKDPKQKVLDILKKKHKNVLKFTMAELLEEIKKIYILEWDKFPPPQCRALAEYIAVKEIYKYEQHPLKVVDEYGDEHELVPALVVSWNEHSEGQFKGPTASDLVSLHRFEKFKFQLFEDYTN